MADLTYESGPVSEGGSQDGISCGKEAASGEVSNKDATWQAEIRSNEPGDADPVPGARMIVCGPKTRWARSTSERAPFVRKVTSLPVRDLFDEAGRVVIPHADGPDPVENPRSYGRPFH